MIAGGVGTGKSTIVQQLILHGIGLRSGPFLNFEVNFPEGVVGYIAADRPRQIKRSMRRMVTKADAEVLADRLDFWRGPLPFDLSTAQVGQLADWVEDRGWSVLVIDSLKDVTGGMSADEDGAAINRQFQELLVRGIQLVVNHHDRKGENRVKVLDDVYGSRWLTAGFGSVLYVQGDAGAEFVELMHLKPPAAIVGPFRLHHDHSKGVTTLDGPVIVRVSRRPGAGKDEVLALIKESSPRTVRDVTAALHVSDSLASRWLKELKESGDIMAIPGAGVADPFKWVLT